MTTLDLQATYDAVHVGLVGVVVPCDVVRVVGAQARSYLEGQCSQDLSALAPGQSTQTLVLSPEGRIDAYGRVVLVSEDELLLVVGSSEGAPLKERLLRFKIRVKADIEVLAWRRAMVRGPRAHLHGVIEPGGVVLPVMTASFLGFDVVSESAQLPKGVPAGAIAAFEVCRIEAGVPAMGRELTAKTIPEEAGIVGDTVSFTKGCFPGQELLARIDARGNNVPRHLRGIVFEKGFNDVAVKAHDTVVIGDKEVGAITSIAFSPRVESRVALGYIHRSVVVPKGAIVRSEGAGELPVRIEALPLISN